MSVAPPQAGKGLTIWSILFGLILLATGLFFTIRGGKLLLGGSAYFLIAGIVILLSAVLFFRRQSLAVGLMLLMFLGTIVWALFDAGWDF